METLKIIGEMARTTTNFLNQTHCPLPHLRVIKHMIKKIIIPLLIAFVAVSTYLFGDINETRKIIKSFENNKDTIL